MGEHRQVNIVLFSKQLIKYYLVDLVLFEPYQQGFDLV